MLGSALLRRPRALKVRFGAVSLLAVACIGGVLIPASPAGAGIVKKANIGATDPALGCSDPFAAPEVHAYANMDQAYNLGKNTAYLDLNNKVFYNEETAAFRDGLRKNYGQSGNLDCDTLNTIMQNAATWTPTQVLQWLVCTQGAAAQTPLWCQATQAGNPLGNRGSALTYIANWYGEQMRQCGGPGRFVQWPGLGVYVTTRSILGGIWSVPVYVRDINIYQGLQSGSNQYAPSQGKVVQAKFIENVLEVFDNTIVPQIRAKWGWDAYRNGVTSITNLINQIWADQTAYPNVLWNGLTPGQYLHAAVTYGCALSPTFEQVDDPNMVATRAAFDKAFRNTFDKLYNMNSSPNVAIGADVLCNPPGGTPGSGPFCGNLYNVFNYVYSLPNHGRQCILDNIGLLIGNGGKPNFFSCTD